MTLRNLLKTGQLVEHKADAAEIGRMLEAATRNIDDAKSTTVSPETRFEAAYRGITQCAMVALWANGFRLSKSHVGHHQTLIQVLPAAVGLGIRQIRLLDTFRVKRNAIDYTGDAVDEESLRACIEAAGDLLRLLRLWLGEQRPDLLQEHDQSDR